MTANVMPAAPYSRLSTVARRCGAVDITLAVRCRSRRRQGPSRGRTPPVNRAAAPYGPPGTSRVRRVPPDGQAWALRPPRYAIGPGTAWD
ncbi:hypothetical protein ACFXHA_45505 [Nocardia sp. NPDC059240]|uniref:hypothetical protein n=1 Tax=Nocardia sp. NPDC059240 TaxID=3346786 RepID=UPI00368D8F07